MSSVSSSDILDLDYQAINRKIVETYEQEKIVLTNKINERIKTKKQKKSLNADVKEKKKKATQRKETRSNEDDEADFLLHSFQGSWVPLNSHADSTCR